MAGGSPEARNLTENLDMNDERKSIEDALGYFGFRLVWSVSDHFANVTAYEITGRNAEHAPRFQRKGATYSPDSVETHESAEEYLKGYVKWDGCTELDMGCPHWCGPEQIKMHCKLLRYIYERAHELMGCEPDEEWIEDS